MKFVSSKIMALAMPLGIVDIGQMAKAMQQSFVQIGCRADNASTTNQNVESSSDDNKEDRSNPTLIFISCSKLADFYKQVPASLLESSLFFFGSKRKWLFPENEADVKEQKRQPGRYHKMDPDFLELVWSKDARREVHFLKSPDLQYEWYPGPPDAKAYDRVSEWLTDQPGGRFKPLILDDSWWKKKNHSDLRTDPTRIIKNYQGGFHEYDEVQELLRQSNPGTVLPIMTLHDIPSDILASAK